MLSSYELMHCEHIPPASSVNITFIWVSSQVLLNNSLHIPLTKAYNVDWERMRAAILMKPSTIPLKDALTYRLQVKQRSQHTLLSCGLQQGGDNTMQHNATQYNTIHLFSGVSPLLLRTYISSCLSCGPFHGVTGGAKLTAAIPVV